MNILIFVQFETEQRLFRRLINKTKSCVTTTAGSFKLKDWLSFTVCDFNHLAPYLKLCKMRSLAVFTPDTKSYPVVQYEQQRHRTGTSRSHTSNIVLSLMAERVWWPKLGPILTPEYCLLPSQWVIQSSLLYYSIHFHYGPNTCSQCTKVWHRTLSAMWLSTLEIGAVHAQFFFVTEMAPKSPFLSVIKSLIRYGFRAGARALR